MGWFSPLNPRTVTMACSAYFFTVLAARCSHHHIHVVLPVACPNAGQPLSPGMRVSDSYMIHGQTRTVQ